MVPSPGRASRPPHEDDLGGTDPHERAVVSGRVLRLRAGILHHSYDDIADQLRSVGKLTAVAAVQRRSPRSIGASRLVFEPLWRFVRFYLLRAGAWEGIPGLYAAATDAFYVFLRWSRVWQQDTGHRFGGNEPPR